MEFDINKIAKLAALKIDDEQSHELQMEMEEIISMARELPEADAADTVTGDIMILRSDIPDENKFTQDELLANAPKIENGCFSVPKIVGE